MKTYSRRSFLKQSTTSALAASVIPSFSAPLMGALQSQAATQDDPHFFLMIYIPFGLDVNYWFDARPLSMTAKGLITNYLGEDPYSYTGSNAGSCLISPAANPLKSWLSEISIVNGVVMSGQFDGHDQNANVLLTGNPFGGESFIPNLRQGQDALDMVISLAQFSPFTISNASASLQLSPAACKQIKESFSKNIVRDGFVDRMNHRFASLAKNQSELGRSTSQFLRNSVDLSSVLDKFRSLDLQIEADPAANDRTRTSDIEAANAVRMFQQIFSHGIARSGMLFLNWNELDAHSFNLAQKSPVHNKEIANCLSQILGLLKNTEYKDGKSFLDVTTVMVTSEFSRTMRNNYSPFAQSGTNHNPLTNTYLFAGKNIKKGQVIGASDFASSDEVLTGAHLQVDAAKEKIMGRPFDFETNRVIQGTPVEKFDASQYLSAPTMMNTVLNMFQIPESKYVPLGRNLPVAPVLKSLIA
jgi:hypothetical protein